MRAFLGLFLICSLLVACRGTQGPDVPDFMQGDPTGGPQLSLPGQYAETGRGVPGGTGVTTPAPPKSTAQIEAARARRTRQAEALWNRGVATKNPSAAADIFEDVADDFPEYPRAAEAKYLQGENAFKAGDYTDAVAALREYMSIAPVNPHLPDVERIIYQSGIRGLASNTGLFSIFKTDDDALNALRYVAGTFPAGEYADDALLRLARYYQQDQEPQTASLFYKEILQRYPDSEWSFQARRGLAATYANRDQGDPYHAGFVDRDPREEVPDDPRAEAHAGPVRSGLELAIEQYDYYTERIERDPARCVEYAQQTLRVEDERRRAKLALARKDDRIAAYYAARGDRAAAEVYRRSAARWRGVEGVTCDPLVIALPGAPSVVPVTPGVTAPQPITPPPPQPQQQQPRPTWSQPQPQPAGPGRATGSPPPPPPPRMPTTVSRTPPAPSPYAGVPAPRVSGASPVPPAPPPPAWPAGR